MCYNGDRGNIPVTPKILAFRRVSPIIYFGELAIIPAVFNQTIFISSSGTMSPKVYEDELRTLATTLRTTARSTGKATS